MNLQDRINELFRDNPDKNQSELAAFLKISRTSVNDWISGKSKSINAANTFGVAKFFNVNPEWVGTGKGKKTITDINEKSPGYSSICNIPIVGQTQLGDDGFWADLGYPEGFGDGYIEFPTKDRQAYALRCVGESMRPRIRNGEFIIIEPSIEVNYGDDVLVKATNDRVMVKKLLYKKDNRIYLQSINENYPTFSLAVNEIAGMYHIAAIVPSNRWIKYP